jgi:hypothetical protein
MIILLCLESWEVRETFGNLMENFINKIRKKRKILHKSPKVPTISSISQKIKLLKVFCSKIPEKDVKAFGMIQFMYRNRNLLIRKIIENISSSFTRLEKNL